MTMTMLDILIEKKTCVVSEGRFDQPAVYGQVCRNTSHTDTCVGTLERFIHRGGSFTAKYYLDIALHYTDVETLCESYLPRVESVFSKNDCVHSVCAHSHS